MQNQPDVYSEDQGRCLFIKVPDYKYESTYKDVEEFIKKYVPSQRNLIKEGDNLLYKKALFCTEWLKNPDGKRTGHGFKRGSEIFLLSFLYGVVLPLIPAVREIFETVQPLWVVAIGCGIFFTGLICDFIYNYFLNQTYLQDLQKSTSSEVDVVTKIIDNPSL